MGVNKSDVKAPVVKEFSEVQHGTDVTLSWIRYAHCVWFFYRRRCHCWNSGFSTLPSRPLGLFLHLYKSFLWGIGAPLPQFHVTFNSGFYQIALATYSDSLGSRQCAQMILGLNSLYSADFNLYPVIYFNFFFLISIENLIILHLQYLRLEILIHFHAL